MFKTIKRRVRNLKNALRFLDRMERVYEADQQQSMHMQADALAYTQLSPLCEKGTYVPITEFSMRPYSIAHLLNEIVINQRMKVVEFGSGIATYFMARLIEEHGLDTKVFSVDHDAQWQTYLRESYVVNEDSVTFVHAPLRKTSKGIVSEQCWYDESVVNSHCASGGKADLIIIDGPPGAICNSARYPAVSFVESYLDEGGAVMVDDVLREAERVIVKDLITQQGFRANWSFNHCMLSKNNGHMTNPLGRMIYVEGRYLRYGIKSVLDT